MEEDKREIGKGESNQCVILWRLGVSNSQHPTNVRMDPDGIENPSIWGTMLRLHCQCFDISRSQEPLNLQECYSISKNVYNVSTLIRSCGEGKRVP
ncbi:hypothetical protein LINPERPRIM_LOCUS2941 [Linum perenne]